MEKERGVKLYSGGEVAYVSGIDGSRRRRQQRCCGGGGVNAKLLVESRWRCRRDSGAVTKEWILAKIKGGRVVDR